MQIHELNNFTGTLGSGSYLAIDDGNDTGKISKTQLFAATEARIDNIIAGPAPSAEEIVDARLGDDGVTYPSLGDAIRDQVGDLKSDLGVNGLIASIKNQNLYEATGQPQYVTTRVSTDKIKFPYDCTMVFNKKNCATALKIGWYVWDSGASDTQFTWSGWKTTDIVEIPVETDKKYFFMWAKTNDATISLSDLSGVFFTSSMPQVVNDLVDDFNELESVCVSKNLIGNEAGVLYPCHIPAGEYITVSTSDGNNFTENGLQIFFYDSNKTQLDYFTLWTSVSSRSVKYDSGDTYYLALNKVDAVPLQAEYGSTKTAYTEYFGSAKALSPDVKSNKESLKRINKATFNLKNALTFRKTRLGYPYGQEATSDDWACTDFISVNKGDAIAYRLSGVNTNSSAIAFYTGAKAAISASSIPTVYGEQSGIAIVPNDAVFVRFCNKIDTDGEIIFPEYIPDNVETDGVPYYWESALSTAEDTIRTNRKTMSAHLVEFAFVTDVHWKNNTKNSPYLINRLTRDVDDGIVVFGGDQITGYNDTLDGAIEELEQFYAPFNRALNIASCVGNHDSNEGNPDASERLTNAQMYNFMLKRMERFAVNNIAELCSYWDNKNQKVRFIQFYRPYDQYITQSVKDWLTSVINELESGWSVVFFSHAFWSSAEYGSPLVTSYYGKSDVDFLVGLCETNSVTPIAWIVGHTHRDYSEVVTNVKSLLVICTTTDAYIYGDDESGYSMTKGTDTEQAFDYFQIDTDNEVIKATRIGAGNDRSWNY